MHCVRGASDVTPTLTTASTLRHSCARPPLTVSFGMFLAYCHICARSPIPLYVWQCDHGCQINYQPGVGISFENRVILYASPNRHAPRAALSATVIRTYVCWLSLDWAQQVAPWRLDARRLTVNLSSCHPLSWSVPVCQTGLPSLATSPGVDTMCLEANAMCGLQWHAVCGGTFGCCHWCVLQMPKVTNFVSQVRPFDVHLSGHPIQYC